MTMNSKRDATLSRLSLCVSPIHTQFFRQNLENRSESISSPCPCFPIASVNRIKQSEHANSIEALRHIGVHFHYFSLGLITTRPFQCRLLLRQCHPSTSFVPPSHFSSTYLDHSKFLAFLLIQTCH